MARANRLSEKGGIFDVTHRCHNREFLLKFARDRDAYRAKLREHLPEFEVGLLDYCLTPCLRSPHSRNLPTTVPMIGRQKP